MNMCICMYAWSHYSRPSISQHTASRDATLKSDMHYAGLGRGASGCSYPRDKCAAADCTQGTTSSWTASYAAAGAAHEAGGSAASIATTRSAKTKRSDQYVPNSMAKLTWKNIIIYFSETAVRNRPKIFYCNENFYKYANVKICLSLLLRNYY